MGIGDFQVNSGKDLARFQVEGVQAVPAADPGLRKAATSSARRHYILLAGADWSQIEPIRFHNGFLEELRARLSLKVRIQLPEMPWIFPAGMEGELSFNGHHALHLDEALTSQSLFTVLQALHSLIRRCADRNIAFQEFRLELDKIPIPADWRNEIVNGLFDHARPSASTESASGLERFVEEVGRAGTGFTLRVAAALELRDQLASLVADFRGALSSEKPVAAALGFLASLQRLAKLVRGREGQTAHLWPEIPADPLAALAGDAGGGEDAAACVLFYAPGDLDSIRVGRARNLADALSCPLLMQLPGDEPPRGKEWEEALRPSTGSPVFLFAGGVASLVDGDACVFRPAAMAFVEGLAEARELPEAYLDKAMVLEDQDVFTGKGPARSSDRLLDQTEADALRDRGVNRVNGVRNLNVARFPPLKAWERA